MFRKICAVAMVAAVTVVAAAPLAAAASEEPAFVSRINGAREGAGLNPLTVYWDLTDDARRHTGAMVDAGEIYHNPNLGSVTSGWWALGENVGVGGDVAGLHEAFMASSPHRANVLGDFNYVGVGTAFSDDGYLYVTVIFMKGPDDLLSPPAEESPAAEEPPPAEETEAAPPSSEETSPQATPARTAAAQPPTPEPIPNEGWLTALIIDLVAADQFPCELPGGLIVA